MNQIRGLWANFGIVALGSVARLRLEPPGIYKDMERGLPAAARTALLDCSNSS